MQIISFFISIIMVLTSFLAPSGTVSQRSIDETFSSLFGNRAEIINDESQQIIMAIVNNIFTEALTNESESEDLVAILDTIPVYENGERDSNREEIRVSSLRKEFGKVMSDMIGQMPDGQLKTFLTMLANGIYDLYIYFVPAEEEDVYILRCDFVDNYGNVKTFDTEAHYDKKTGKVYGIDDNGMVGIGFDFDINNYLVTTPVHPWQRNFGYSVFYDIIGEMGFMSCDTVRIKFEHGGKYWMFQLWKGNYTFGLLNGAEIGIYNKTDKCSLMYDCVTDEEMLDMSMKVTYGDEVVVNREEMKHWWLCGFRFGTPIPQDELQLNGTIRFEDEEMMNSFLEASQEFSDEMTVSADGMKVTIIWK